MDRVGYPDRPVEAAAREGVWPQEHEQEVPCYKGDGEDEPDEGETAGDVDEGGGAGGRGC